MPPILPDAQHAINISSCIDVRLSHETGSFLVSQSGFECWQVLRVTGLLGLVVLGCEVVVVYK